jgi:hypothetical protein
MYFVNVMLGYIIILLDYLIIELISSEMELDFFKNRTGNFSSLDLELEHELDFCYVAPALEMMKSSAFIFTVYICCLTFRLPIYLYICPLFSGHY